MKILADENISARLVERLREKLPPSEEIEIVTKVIESYGDKLLASFSVIMPRGVRIRPV